MRRKYRVVPHVVLVVMTSRTDRARRLSALRLDTVSGDTSGASARRGPVLDTHRTYSPVVEPPPPPAAENPIVKGLTDVLQQAQEGRLPLAVGVAILAAGLVAGVLLGLLILALVRRLRARRV